MHAIHANTSGDGRVMPLNPRVSVIITLYNKAAYINRAVSSVLQQNYSDYEVLVIDDGSTDGGEDLVAKIPDPRIRVIRQDNQGEGVARNRGIRESRGAIIAMLDADDEWDPEFLAAIVALATRFPEAGILATGYRSVHRCGLVLETTLVPPCDDSHLLVTDYFRRACVAGFVWSSAQAVRRAVYQDVGVFVEREPMGPDLDMWGRIALRYPVGYDCRVLASYRSDADGRVVTAWGRRPTFPPFVRSARIALMSGDVKPHVLSDLCEYVDRLLLQYLDRVIGAGDRCELRRSLTQDFFPTRVFRRDLFLLGLASRLLPMRILRLVRRVQLSRLTLIIRPKRVEHGVVIRKLSKAQSYGARIG
jgi:glycosyltransferase involved in cell wall biosynthesis